VILLAPVLAAAVAAAPSSLEVPGFGRVVVHASADPPARVVLLLSGAGGLDPAAQALEETLATHGALVVGTDTSAYLAAHPPGRCLYPAGDLEELAQRVEKLQRLEAYSRPIVVGHSRGAAIAWAAVAQAPAGTFAAGVAIAPCPERPLPARLCAAAGPPPRRLEGGELPALVRPPAPLEIVSGADDVGCPAQAAERLATALGARFTLVPGAAHALDPAVGEAVAAAVGRLSPARSVATLVTVPGVADLPLVEVPAATGNRLAVLLTGDGGWVGIDKALAGALSEEGVAVVGLDSLRYFWKRRTPEETARDVARVLAHYAAAWGRDEFLLVGYSRGADLAPFVAARLPPEQRERLRLVAMLGPGTFAEFEVHAIDLFSSVRRRDALSTEEAVRDAGGKVPMLCVHGAEEHDSLCPRIADVPWVKRILLPGGHHFDGGYPRLARMVLDAAR